MRRWLTTGLLLSGCTPAPVPRPCLIDTRPFHVEVDAGVIRGGGRFNASCNGLCRGTPQDYFGCRLVSDAGRENVIECLRQTDCL